MLIDWFTVVAQIINFLVLVALMKHFLYGRLVDAIDARERRIAASLADADRKNREAEQRVEHARQEEEKEEREREQMIAAARQEADRQRQDMLQKARDSVRALETKWHEDLEREKAAFLEEIRARAANEILAISRRALQDLACADLQQCAIDSFFKKLDSTGPAAFEKDVVLLSPTELSAETRHRMEETLRPHMVNGAHLTFETAPQMSWGIELRSNGRRIGWNPESYISSLEENLRQALEHRSQ